MKKIFHVGKVLLTSCRKDDKEPGIGSKETEAANK